MRRLNLTKSEVKALKNEIYFTEDEEKLLELWLCEKTIIQISQILNISEASVSRLKLKLWKKIENKDRILR